MVAATVQMAASVIRLKRDFISLAPFPADQAVAATLVDRPRPLATPSRMLRAGRVQLNVYISTPPRKAQAGIICQTSRFLSVEKT